MRNLTKILLTGLAFLAIGSLSWAEITTSPTFKNVTINGTLTLNGVLGKFVARGSAPSISSCGSSPSVTGTDNSMKLNMGSGTLTSCVINFATTWLNAPSCVAFPANDTAAATGTTLARLATTGTQLTFTGSNLTSANYHVLCW